MFDVEGLDVGPVALRHEGVHLLFRRVQGLLALARQAHAAFELGEGFLQGQLAPLHALDDGLQLGEGLFEVETLFGGVAHGDLVSSMQTQYGSPIPKTGQTTDS